MTLAAQNPAARGSVTRTASGAGAVPATGVQQDAAAIRSVAVATAELGPVTPDHIMIPSISVDARVEPVGVDSTRSLETPENVWNVGWYSGGPSPGAQGDAVIDGHVGYPWSPLVFGELSLLNVGADVLVLLSDGTRLRFIVTDRRSWASTASPPGLFRRDGPPTLSLITCAGAYDPVSSQYPDRLIVEAGYVGPV
ncbi:MAG: class F sortase [Candidatus Dormibacteria bacterium]